MRVRVWSAAVSLAVLTAGLTVPTSAAAAPPDAPPPLPLERHFDNRGVSDDARPTDADLDGAGNSLSAQDLAAAGWSPGQPLDLDGTRLTWPDTSPGEPDNVVADGQRVALRGAGETLSFLALGSSPDGPGADVEGHGTVRYTDGSDSPYTLSVPDWRAGPLATKAVGLPHLNTPAGQRSERLRLYAVTVPLRPGHEVESVTLPADPGPDADLHVFALAVRGGADAWTGTWASGTSGYTTVGPWSDQTLRLVVHSSIGGPALRLRLANTFADQPLRLGRVSVAVQAPGGGATARERPVPLTFDGQPGTTVPAGAQVLTDPLRFPVPENTNLLVSIHLPDPVQAAPVHHHALQRSFVSAPGSGDRTTDPGGADYPEEITFWPFLSGVDVEGGPGSVVTLGDSITDGDTSTEGGNNRWPDVLARRLLEESQQQVPRYGVLNQGISANQVVRDRYPGDGVSTDPGGVSAQHRLERDALAQTGVRTLVVFMGINDVRNGTGADALSAGLRSLAVRADDRGLRVVAATIAPCGGFHDCTAEVDARRTAVNDWLREGGTVEQGGPFDAVLDFDAVLRDPADPSRILPAYDSGDHLHPGDTGLRALAESVDLRLLVPDGG